MVNGKELIKGEKMRKKMIEKIREHLWVFWTEDDWSFRSKW